MSMGTKARVPLERIILISAVLISSAITCAQHALEHCILDIIGHVLPTEMLSHVVVHSPLVTGILVIRRDGIDEVCVVSVWLV